MLPLLKKNLDPPLDNIVTINITWEVYDVVDKAR